MKRQVFFSFQYKPDNWRAGMVRNMGKVDDSSTFSDNDWEEVRRKSDKDIEEWIEKQMKMRSCIVVLIGSTTSQSKWVKYEIERAYYLNKGIVGIYINKLEDSDGNQSYEGCDPFYSITTYDGKRLSNFVETFRSSYSTSKYVYNDIKDNLEGLIERAIEKAGTY